MSMIGDYIHFHKDNYKKWGTSKVGRSISNINIQSIPLASYFNDSQIQQLIMESKYLEEEYNKMFYPSEGEVSEKTKIFKKNLEEIIQKKLNEEFGAAAGSFNSSTLSVDKNILYTKLNNAIRETKNRLGMAKIAKNNTANNLLKQVELMFNILNQQEFKNITEIQSRIEEVKSQLNNIKMNLLMEINTTGGNIKTANIEDVQTLGNIIQEFNRIPLLYKQNRIIFEWLAPFIEIQTTSIAKNELAKTMESLASQEIKITIDPEDKQKEKDINIDIENVNIKTISSNKNSSITIQYKDSEGKMQKRNIISKNIKTGSTEIQLLNQTSLYQLLTLSNTYNFANHYLNIITAAPGQTSSIAEILEANRLLKSSILNSIIENYNSINFLIINDYKKKKIFVYSVKLLLYMIDKSLLNGNNKYLNIINLEDDYTISNNYEDTVATRIGKVLINTKNKKINGIITPSMFNVYKNALIAGRP